MDAILNINDFRLPEEIEYSKILESHPGTKKLRKKISKVPPGEETHKFLWLNFLTKEGVRITKSDRSDVIESFEKSFSLFGQNVPPYQVFGIKNLDILPKPIRDENCLVVLENGTVIVIFVHNILNTLTESEAESVIGHEIGHFLLGHTQNELLNQVIDAFDNMEERDIIKSDLADLLISSHLLSQLQELSADRVGLIVSRDLESTICGLAKIAGGLISERLNTEEYIKQAMEAPPEADDIWQTHPYHPHRSWALAEFYESEPFMKMLGKENGKPLAEFSRLLPKIIPYPDTVNSKGSLTAEDESSGVDDYLLELILYNEIAWADGKFTRAEIKGITKFVPMAMREEVFRRWNEMTKDWDSKTDDEMEKILEETCKKLAHKDEKWKTKVVRRMIKVVRADRRVYEGELARIAEIAEKIGARDQCKRQCLKEFGYDPFAQNQEEVKTTLDNDCKVKS